MRIILAFSLVSLFQIGSWSQNLYLTASTGYNFSAGKSNFENYVKNNLVGAFYPYNLDRFQYSLGKGQNISLGLGYSTNYNIGFELEGSYLLGIKTIGESEYTDNSLFKKELWSRFYRLSPSVHFIRPFKGFSLKMQVGGLFGLGKMYLNQIVIYKDEENMRYENEFSGGYYLGFKAGIGVLYPINDRFKLFLDMNWVSAYYSPTRARNTKFTSGPYDYLDNISIWEKETIYSNSVEKLPYNPDVPAQRLRENFAASSIGLQVGIQWSLWTKKAEEKAD